MCEQGPQEWLQLATPIGAVRNLLATARRGAAVWRCVCIPSRTLSLCSIACPLRCDAERSRAADRPESKGLALIRCSPLLIAVLLRSLSRHPSALHDERHRSRGQRTAEQSHRGSIGRGSAAAASDLSLIADLSVAVVVFAAALLVGSLRCSSLCLSQYDYSVSTFSPNGRVFQVEYAAKAVEKSGSVAQAQPRSDAQRTRCNRDGSGGGSN